MAQAPNKPANKRQKGARKRAKKRAQHGLRAFVEEHHSGGLFRFNPLATLSDRAVLWVKFFVGLALLPLCWIFLETFLVLLQADTFGANGWKSREFLAFAFGGLTWLALFFSSRTVILRWFGRAVLWLYVAGHELTHAFFALVCRGQVSEVRISTQGGHILTDRTNFLISLSPYFFPFYTALLMLAWGAVEWLWFDFQPEHLIYLNFFIGLTWMFHISFTVFMMRREQSDITQNGKLFSYTVTFLVNLAIISVMLVAISQSATLRQFAQAIWENATTLPERVRGVIREVTG